MKYIGLFDSGLGGLTVAKVIKQNLPTENIVFLADNKNMPYGSKTNEEIISFSTACSKVLDSYDLKAMIIACNTSDSISGKTLKGLYDYPVFGVIDAACESAYNLSKNKKIAVLATPACISSRQYEIRLKQLDESITVYPVACDKLAPMIEQGLFLNNNPLMKETIKEYLSPAISNNIDTVILGCTHYDLIDTYVKDLLPKVNIVSSSRCVVSKLKQYLETNNLLNNEKDLQDIYISTADPSSLNSTAKYIINDIEIKEK